MTRLHMLLLFSFIFGLSACSPAEPPTPTPTAVPPTSTVTPSATPSPSPTPTPLTCLTQPGRVDQGRVATTDPPQEFLVYLPPCYGQATERRYPVLYLLHGQTYTDDQWVRLGAATVADELILYGGSTPFILVFPDDRYWNLPPGAGFGDRLVNDLIPYIDRNYRTLADRDHRALGGLSRGGGWAVHLMLTHYNLFGMVGLHSPVIFDEDAAMIKKLVGAVPSAAWPRLWLDAGDRDGDLGKIRAFEGLLTDYEVAHEWHLYTGDHTENYWHAHVVEYLQWYAQGWAADSSQVATPAPQP